MRILHLSSERSWRGGEQQIAYLIEGLKTNNIECFVGCKQSSAFEKWCNDSNTEYFSLGFKNELDLLTALKIKRYCRKNHIDIIHTHSSHSQAMAVWANILGADTPIICSRRVDFPVKNNALSLLKFNHKSIQRIVSISKTIEKVLKPSIKDHSKLRVVYSGIDLGKFKGKHNTGILHQDLNLSNDIKIIANVSAIAPHKDYETFVNTAEKVAEKRSDIKFVIIGDGPDSEKIRSLVKNRRLNKQILFTGFRNDIPDILSEIDVFLITSKTEGLGTTILDAFANKIPVVATAGGGIPEAVIHNKTGLLADVGDSDSLAEYVNELLNNEELKNKLTDNAYHHLLENFTTQSMVDGNIKVYKELLNEN